MHARLTLLCAWLFLLVGGTLHGQTLLQAEYFWDADPGAGLATPMSATDGSFSTAFEQVSASADGMQGGLHTLGIRMKGADGNWGPVFRAIVDVVVKRAVQLTQAEYFWDTDPGAGNGIPMLAFDGNFNSAFEQANASAAAPTVGLHALRLRVKGADGLWGPVFSTIVDVVQARQVTLTTAEYFWDMDPGEGNGTTLIAFDGNFSSAFEQVSTSASTADLYVGPHVLNVRVKGSDNSWGPVFRTVVQVDPQPPVTFNFDLRVALQGCMGSTLMNNTLRNSGLVPLVEPYSVLGYELGLNTGASTSSSVMNVTFPPGSSVVDWILVEFHPAQATWQVAERIPMLLRRGGTVSLADGSFPFLLTLPAGSYYVVVRHRNHLPIATAVPVLIQTNGQSVMINFTSAAAQAYGTDAQVLTGSLYCMWAGDVQFNGNIQYTGAANDRDPVLVSVGSTTPNNMVVNIYSTRDVNMDGQVKYTGSGNDRDPILVNVGSTTPNNIRTQQLP